MHILVVGRTLPDSKRSAYGVFEFEQACQLNRKNNTGFLFVNTSSIKLSRKVKFIHKKYKGVNIVGAYLPVGGLPDKLYKKIQTYLFIKVFNKYVSEHGMPDVVHIHFPLILLNNEVINFLITKKIKIVMTEHWSKIQYKLLSIDEVLLLKKVIAKADVFITVSDELRMAINELTERNNDIKVIPNMVNDDFYDIPILQENSTKFTFTFIGRLVKKKRVDFLINAFKRKFDKCSNIQLKIIGNGPMMNKLKRQSLGTNNIIFTGNLSRDELVKELSRSSAFVTASNYETFGVPVIEAMSLGIPVICSDEIPVSVYVNTDNGMLFNPNKSLDLENKLEKMHSEIAHFTPEVIRNESYEKFSSNTVTNKLLELYFAII